MKKLIVIEMVLDNDYNPVNLMEVFNTVIGAIPRSVTGSQIIEIVRQTIDDYDSVLERS